VSAEADADGTGVEAVAVEKGRDRRQGKGIAGMQEPGAAQRTRREEIIAGGSIQGWRRQDRGQEEDERNEMLAHRTPLRVEARV
jgi:hypothetical protein